MLTCKRRHDYLRRRVLWTLALAVSAPSWAEDQPENKLRSAAEQPVLKQNAEHNNAAEVSKASSVQSTIFEFLPLAIDASPEPTQVGGFDLPVLDRNVEPLPSVSSNMMLVSDGWQARNSIDPDQPLVDQAASPPSYAADKPEPTDDKKFVTDEATEPKSIFRIIVSETALPSIAPPSVRKPSSESLPTKQPPANPESSKPSPHSLYGPGPSTASSAKPADSIANANTAPKLDNASAIKKIDELLKNLSTINPGLNSIPNPEQNEPAIELGAPSKRDAAGSDALSVKPEGVCGDESTMKDDVELTELDAIAPEEISPLPGRLQVRDLKNLGEGAVDPPSITRSTPAEPISRREAPREAKVEAPRETKIEAPRNSKTEAPRDGSKQSIGDEPVQLPAATSKKGDRIGPNKELILSIGMEGSQNRVNSNTARLRASIERTLRHYWATPEDAKERTHWGMFHNLMIYDKDTLITDGKRRFNAVAWMAGNNPCRNQLLFEEDDRGIVVRSGVGLQGHQAQMLAVFGLIDVPASYPIFVGRTKYNVDDVIEREMLDCKTGNELTFTLIGLSHYIDTNTQWTAGDGQTWNFERLIKEELAQPVVGAACGGTHRLMGFAHALRRRRAEGRPITGQWERADRYVKDFIAYTWQLQNRDGSMSTSWFEKSEDNGEMDRKIQTTGHMVEFLLTALPDDQLQSPQLLRSMSFLVNTLYEERGHDWPVGPKGHALRALAMYYRRVFDRADPWRPVAVARHGSATTK